MTKIGLRNMWFTVHKWIGLLLAVLVIPISLTGAALVWHDPVDRLLNPARHAVTGLAERPVPAYLDAARGALPTGEVISEIHLPVASGDPVEVVAGKPGPSKGRPVRTLVYLDPADARVIEAVRSDAGLIRFMHVLHGSLFVPEVGRQIVGWIGVAMLVSAISGIWLWWPTVGNWLRGLRWRRQPNTDGNLHHLLGFWIAVPLAILSFTGMWISFPQTFGVFEAQSRPSGPPRGRPAVIADPVSDVSNVVALAQAVTPGRVTAIEWPTEGKTPSWSVDFAGADGTEKTVRVEDVNGRASIEPARAPPPETLSRLMRRLHDGDNMPFWWQLLVFLGGILPAILAITGIIMWARTRGWRNRFKARQKAARVLEV